MESRNIRSRVRAMGFGALIAQLVAVGVVVVATAASGGCQSGGGQVTGSDRPAEGVDWNVDEQMARDRGN